MTATTDPFAIFGIEPSFLLELPELERRHRDLSRALHPDRYAGHPASERRAALGRAIEVNAAYRALKDPIRRAEVLLRARGLELAEGAEPKPGADFLMEILELREALSAAAKARDGAAIARLSADVQAKEQAATEALARALVREAGASALNEAAARLGELRYYRRFAEEASALEDEL